MSRLGVTDREQKRWRESVARHSDCPTKMKRDELIVRPSDPPHSTGKHLEWNACPEL